MPKKVPTVKISLDLLRSQSQPKRLVIKVFNWLLSSGRLLIVVVEILVLAAFLARFKLDSDLSTTREAIEQQVPFIESLASDEALIRQTQFQLATVREMRQDSPDYVSISQKIAKQTPSGIILKTLSMTKNRSNADIRIAGTASDNTQLTSFIAGLRADSIFQDLDLVDVSLEGGTLNFTITVSTKLTSNQERKS